MTHPTAKLGDVAAFIRGITFKPDDVVPLDADDAVVCMRTKNVQTLLDCDDLLAVPSQFVRRKDQYLHEGDILVSSANSWNLVGKCCWVPALPWRSAFGGFISVLRGDSTRVDRRYLYWWFASERIQALLRSFGQKTTNISNLNIDRCLQLELPLPPIHEQRRIAAILDKADALRTKRREALVQLDHLSQSIFVEMFGDPATNPKGWPWRPLGSLAKKFSDGPFGSNLKSEHYVESGVRVVRLQNIGVGDFIDNDKAYISEEHFERIAKHECVPGDILVGTLGDPNLRACSLPPSIPLAINKADCVQIRVEEKDAHAAFVCALLNHPSTEALAQSLMHGQTRVRISMGSLRELKVPVPPIALQRDFAERVGGLGLLKETQTKSAVELNTLFGSLQQRAFAGQL